MLLGSKSIGKGTIYLIYQWRINHSSNIINKEKSASINILI